MSPQDCEQDFYPVTLVSPHQEKAGDSPQIKTTWQKQMNIQSSGATVSGVAYQLLRCADGSVTFPFISENCVELVEVEAADIVTNADRLLGLLHPDDRSSFEEAIASAPPGMFWHWQGRCILPSKTVKWLEWNGFLLPQSRAATGDQLWQGFFIDVTDQRRLNAEFEQLSFLLGLTERLQASTDLQEVARFALDYFVQATDCAFGDVKVICQNENIPQAFPLVNHISAQFVATYGKAVTDEMEAILRQGQPYGQGLLWRVVETGEPMFVSDYANHPSAVPAFRHPGIGQIGVFPIPASDDSIIGVLTLESRNLYPIQDIPHQALILAACRVLGIRIEQTRAQERLRKQAQELEKTINTLQRTQMQLVQTEKMSSLGQLVAGVAHEINNPVSFIHGNLPHADRYIRGLLNVLTLYQQYHPIAEPELQNAIDEVDIDFVTQDLPKLLRSMRVGAERIRDIVRSLRNFSRLDESEMKFVNIHDGIDNTLVIVGNRLRAQAERPEIEVIKEYADLPLVECYAGQLNQVFMNVLVNAIDALEDQLEDERDRSKQDGSSLSRSAPKITIQTEFLAANADAEIKGDRVAIHIIDNGVGISKIAQKRLFDPFFTTKPIGKGTGMGLSISYQIVTERHRGQLSCISTPGQGSEFIIEIPVQQRSTFE